MPSNRSGSFRHQVLQGVVDEFTSDELVMVVDQDLAALHFSFHAKGSQELMLLALKSNYGVLPAGDEVGHVLNRWNVSQPQKATRVRHLGWLRSEVPYEACLKIP